MQKNNKFLDFNKDGKYAICYSYIQLFCAANNILDKCDILIEDLFKIGVINFSRPPIIKIDKEEDLVKLFAKINDEKNAEFTRSPYKDVISIVCEDYIYEISCDIFKNSKYVASIWMQKICLKMERNENKKYKTFLGI